LHVSSIIRDTSWANPSLNLRAGLVTTTFWKFDVHGPDIIFGDIGFQVFKLSFLPNHHLVKETIFQEDSLENKLLKSVHSHVRFGDFVQHFLPFDPFLFPSWVSGNGVHFTFDLSESFTESDLRIDRGHANPVQVLQGGFSNFDHGFSTDSFEEL